MVTLEKGLYKNGLSNSHPAIVKLKEGRVLDVTREELTHPRIVHLYNQEHLLITSLPEGLYDDCIKRLHRINNLVDLEIYLHNLEEGYRKSLTSSGYEQGDAAQKAHDILKAARKVWYRMRTNFDTIEELHNQRGNYIGELGDYLYNNTHIRKITDLMLMIKDLATGTDGWESDMDLAFSFDVKDNVAARNVAINAIEPTIRNFELQHNARPTETAHIDWKDQTYATRWLRVMSRQPPLQEKTFDGLRTNTHARSFLTETIFGIRNGIPLSIPVYPISKKEIYDELMAKFT